jgi:peptidoglycan/xylan/chitin deacetylase (PgdA/CDA1 family)
MVENMNKIINFHNIHNIRWFEDVIYLLQSKYKLISIKEFQECFIGNTKFNRPFCHITVDDGDKTFYNVIFPILIKHNVPASIFVSPKISKEECNFWFQEIQGYNPIHLKRIISDVSNIPLNLLGNFHPKSIMKNLQIHQIKEIIKIYQDKTNTPAKPCQNMTIKQLIEIGRSGLIDIGAHTMNHPILANENDEISNYEISESINMLSNLLGNKICFFAFPNGQETIDFTEREINYLRNNEIQLAFSNEPRDFLLSDNPMSIPRTGLSYGNKYFIQTKLFIGSYWETTKKIFIRGESQERAKLAQIVNSHYALNLKFTEGRNFTPAR